MPLLQIDKYCTRQRQQPPPPPPRLGIETPLQTLPATVTAPPPRQACQTLESHQRELLMI
jgi:hypothetical protein